MEFVFAPEERDVYSYERTPKDLAPLGAKPGSGTIGNDGKDDCAPTELRSKETIATAINISPLWREETKYDLLHFQVESTNEKWKILYGKCDFTSADINM